MKDLPEIFSVGDEYLPILTMLYSGLQKTALWDKVKGSCFCAAGFVSLAFTAIGRQVRILPCYVVAVNGNTKFSLGDKEMTDAPGQIDGHVVCLVDETILVDFGLNNVSHYCWPDFPPVAALKVIADNIFPSELDLGKRRKIIWRNDWVNAATDAVMADHRLGSEMLYKQYQTVMP